MKLYKLIYIQHSMRQILIPCDCLSESCYWIVRKVNSVLFLSSLFPPLLLLLPLLFPFLFHISSHFSFASLPSSTTYPFHLPSLFVLNPFYSSLLSFFISFFIFPLYLSFTFPSFPFYPFLPSLLSSSFTILLLSITKSFKNTSNIKKYIEVFIITETTANLLPSLLYISNNIYYFSWPLLILVFLTFRLPSTTKFTIEDFIHVNWRTYCFFVYAAVFHWKIHYGIIRSLLYCIGQPDYSDIYIFSRIQQTKLISR